MSRVSALASAVILGLLLAVPAAQSAEEFRGLYVDAFHPGLLNHEQVTQMVSAAKQANFNALFVQVRKRGDVLYSSTIEPKFTKVAEGYDPLADVIAQAHAAGMEVHAWLSVYEVSSTWYKLSPTHICRTHPDWLMSDREGKTEMEGRKIFVDPGLPAVRDHMVSMVREILKSYNVDGIYLENPRYLKKNHGYNPASVAAFNESTGSSGKPADADEAWCQWRSDQITTLIRNVHDAIALDKPKVKFSVSVSSATPDVANEALMQDWGAWVSGDLVDFVVPMLYVRADDMMELAPEAKSSVGQKTVYIGIGAYQVSAEAATKHIRDARTAGAKGVVVYSYYFCGPNADKAKCARLSDLAASVFSEAATIPATEEIER